MRHLYQKIYLTMIASLLLVVVVAGGGWRIGGGERVVTQAFEMAGELAAAALPAPDAPRADQQTAIEQLGRKLRLDLALFDGVGRPIASYGRPLPPPPEDMTTGGWLHGRFGPAWSFRLPDGRWIVARAPMRHRNPAVGLALFLGVIALVVAVAAFPVVRGLTRRLERLQTGVETLGAGRLSARVKVEGRDEVARLAASFNRAAARIEELVGAHRMLLANASHELRTPLSRLRLGLELYEQRQDPAVKAELARDIAELDGLIDEILLASRLDAAPALHAEPLDLLGLAAEECAHYDDCTLTGAPVTIHGDARLLRRLIRNLLDNARRHGAPPIAVSVSRRDTQAVIEVADGGVGIPEAERDKVFMPFHRVGGESKGAGLGLALVRQIARLHGGDAAVAPRPGQPSCLEVTLPMA
ncbi:MAG TPA: HAMP domain-containing sensor histidine kinase [Xanthobacteraceae bacterium]|nr:HAMP domain-containing sensor histidine kinase [Xanthobacteraceae bacterium]